MKKQIVVIALLLCLLTGCGNGKNKIDPEANVNFTGDTTIYATQDDLTYSQKIDYIAALKGTAKAKNVNVEFPKSSDDYIIAVTNYGVNITTTATDPDGSNDIVTCWMEYHFADDTYSVHYFDYQGGVVIDDGKIKE